MANYAQVENDLVVNIIVADDKVHAEEALNCKLVEIIDSNPAGIGYFFDEANNVFMENKPGRETMAEKE